MAWLPQSLHMHILWESVSWVCFSGAKSKIPMQLGIYSTPEFRNRFKKTNNGRKSNQQTQKLTKHANNSLKYRTAKFLINKMTYNLLESDQYKIITWILKTFKLDTFAQDL